MYYSFFGYAMRFPFYFVTIPYVNVSLNAPRLNQDSSTRPKFKVAFLKLSVSSVLIVHTCKFRPARSGSADPLF
jgi:hypothetical protein